MGSDAIGSVLAHQAAIAERIEAAARSTVDTALGRYVIFGEWRVSRKRGRWQILLHARHATLTLVGPAASEFVEFESLSLYEDVVLTFGVRAC